MPFSTKVQEFLEINQVSFKHTVHPLAYTAREVASAEHLPPRDVAKVVIVSADNEYQMVVLPANRALDLSELRTSLGMCHARLATEQEIGHLFPDCDLGAMPPFGNLYNMPSVCGQRPGTRRLDGVQCREPYRCLAHAVQGL